MDRLGHVLHLFTLGSFRFARLTKSVEGRLREGAPVAPGLPADAVAVGAHRDGDLVDAEGRGLLPALALAPDGAGSDLLPRLGLRLALGVRVDPVDLRLPAQLLREEVVDGPGLLHAVQRLDARGSGGPRGVAVRAAARLGAPAEHVRGSVDSSLDRPSRADHGRRRPRGHQSPCRCARSAGHRQGALAQGGQSSARFHGRRRLRSRGRHLRRRSEAFRCFRLRHLLRGEALDVLRRLALHLRRPLPRPLQQGLHFAGPSDDLGGRHLVRWGGRSRWAPGDSERAVQPVAAAPQHVHGLVLRDAPHRCRRARRASRHDRLCGLNAALPHAASQRRGPGRVQPVVAQGLPGIAAPVVAVGQEGWPGELSGGAREGDPIVALVRSLERSRRVQRGVGQRRLADGLRGVGVIIEIEVTGSVDRGVALGQVQGEGLALLNVPEDLAKAGLDAEASASAFLHLYLHQPAEHLAVATVSSRGHVPRHSVDALALGRRVP